MTTWHWPGARWWKCDLHVHTSGSADVQDGAPEDIIAAAQAQALDVIGITDHNSGAMVAEIADAIQRSNSPVIAMPGTELTVGGIHLLILFDPGMPKDHVVAFLGACGIPGAQQGNPEAHAKVTILDAVRHAATHNGVVIAAHIDDVKGLLTVVPNGQDLIDIVCNDQLLAGEVRVGDAALLAFTDNSMKDYRRRFGPLVLIEASDAHCTAQVGSSATWIKMTSPSVEGLRLALLDGNLSVARCSAVSNDANQHARLVLESVTVRDSKLIGRGEDFVLRFNPWFNAIIGGRGTGKSTVLEFIRLALEREDELPTSLRPEFDLLASIPGHRGAAGLLSSATRIDVVYRKDTDRFTIGWENGDRRILRQMDDGSWAPSEGIIPRRFPIKIFSQKQIFELARDPAALLLMVDRAIEEEDGVALHQVDAAQSDYAAARREATKLREDLSVEGGLRGELEDVTRRIALYESAEHAAVRKEYRTRTEQQSAVQSFGEDLDELGTSFSDFTLSITAPTLDPSLFQTEDETDAVVLAAGETVRAQIIELVERLAELRDEAVGLRAAFDATLARAPQYATRLEHARKANDVLKQRLAEAGAELDDYNALVERRSELDDELRSLEALKPHLAEADKALNEAAQAVTRTRKKKRELRADFIERTVGDSGHVRIEVIPYGSGASAESRLRDAIGRPEGGFEKDIDSLLEPLYQGYGAAVPTDAELQAFEERLAAARQHLLELAQGNDAGRPVRDARFANHLQTLTGDALCQLETWAPDDALRVAYSLTGDGRDFKPIEHGSPGQKTAALLAFILSYGDSPIILDQPEDDLENRLIYDLVVRRVRDVKRTRQVLIVTHDANVVVNGDAECVAVFDFHGGRTRIAQQGGLQQLAVRDSICEVLEGGRHAFEERYRRIGDGEALD